jgi:hypothetical protein
MIPKIALTDPSAGVPEFRLAYLTARNTAKNAATPAKAKPKPVPPTGAPTQLRDQGRTTLLRLAEFFAFASIGSAGVPSRVMRWSWEITALQ